MFRAARALVDRDSARWPGNSSARGPAGEALKSRDVDSGDANVDETATAAATAGTTGSSRAATTRERQRGRRR